MSHTVDFPPMCDARVDRQTVIALFDDVLAHTTLLEVMRKGDPQRRATVEARDARLALTWLLDDSDLAARRAVQLRYAHDGVEWWDTILRLRDGEFRIVRVRHDFSTPDTER